MTFHQNQNRSASFRLRRTWRLDLGILMSALLIFGIGVPPLAAEPTGASRADTRRSSEQITPVVSAPITLRQALADLSQDTHEAVWLHDQALVEAGFDLDLRRQLTLFGGSLEQQLRAIVQAFSSEDGVRLAVLHQDGLHTVADEHWVVARQPRELKVYDCRDLMPQDKGNSGAADQRSVTHDEVAAQLMQLIQDTVGNADHWNEQGDVVGALHGQLLVKTTQKNHDSIQRLLDQLRQSSPTRSHGDAGE